MRNPTRNSAQSNALILTLFCLTALLTLAGHSWLPVLRHVLAEGLKPAPSDISPVVRANEGDTTFGTNGRVVVTFDASSEANDVAVQTDDKIVVVGNYLNAARLAGGMALARLNTDGSLDQTFGNGGKVTTPPPGPVGGDRAQAVVIQPDGKILVAGDGRGNTSQAGVLRRFNADGSPDMSFGSGGRVFTEIPTQGVNLGAGFNDVALMPDGGIVAGGHSRFQINQPNSNILIARFLPTGAPNTSFGGLNGAMPGTVVVEAGGFDSANAIAEIRSGDNQILMAGSVRNFGPNPSQFQDGIVLVRLNLADGGPAITFGGGDGIETVLLGPGSDAEANAVAWLPGTTTASSNPASRSDVNERSPEANSDHSVVVGRLGLRYFGSFHQPNGSLDTNRAVNGVFLSSITEGGRGARYWLPTGDPSRILSAGTTTPDPTNPSDKDFSVLGLSFVNRVGIDFTYKFDFNNGSSDAARAIAVQTDANVVLAGVTEVQGEQQIGVIRLGPPLPPVFFGSSVDNIIRRIDPVTGAVANFTSLPPASGEAVTLRGLATEQTADLTPGRSVAHVRNSSGAFLYLIASDGTVSQLSASLNLLEDPVIDSDGNLFYTDSDPGPLGEERLNIRPGITGAPRTIPIGNFINPNALAVRQNGDVYVVATEVPSGEGALIFLRRTGIDADGVPTFAAPEVAFRGFSASETPGSIAFDRAGENIFFAPLSSGTVRQLIPVNGGPSYQLGPNSASGLGLIRQITVTESGEVLVTDGGDLIGGVPGAIYRLNSDLTPIGGPLTGTDIQNPTGIAATQTLPPSADLSVSYRVSGISNPFINYEATLQNTGLAAAENVQVTITVPPNTSFSNLDAAPGFTCTSTPDSEGKLTCTNPLVAAGAAAATFGLNVTANADGIFTSTATVTTTSREGDPSNNTATASAAIGVLPTLSVSDAIVTEGNGGGVNAVVTFSLSAAVQGTVRFTITNSDGTALAGSDYVAIQTTRTGINPLQTRRTFNFLVNGDTIIEPDENFFVNISDPTGATIADAQGQVTITDDDAPPPPTVSISDVRVVEGTGPIGTTMARFNVSLSRPTDQPVIVNHVTASGTATTPEDYVQQSGSNTIGPGETSTVIFISLNADAVDELDESFFVNLTGVTNATIADGQGEGTIVDDDEPPPTVSISDVRVVEGTGDVGTTMARFNVSLSRPTDQPVRVNYATASGTATTPEDYGQQSGSNTISPGETSTVIFISLNADAVDELDETFFVNLTGVTNATIADGQGEGTIVDDDGPPTPNTVQFSAALSVVNENTGNAIITVTRSGDLSTVATVDYATSDGTGSERSDYTTAVGTLRFAAGEASKSFMVLLTDDRSVEPDETIILTLSNPTGGMALGTLNVATLNITSNDTSPPTSNPIEETEFFVEQLYHDFLNRAADPAGKAFWMDQITSCGADTQCRDIRRINVSAAFFLSIEFQQTGFLVYRAHQAAFNTGPALSFRDFLRDTQEIGRGVVVGQAGWEQLLEANKQAFFSEFVTRPQFVTRYPLTLTAAQYIDALNSNTGGSLSEAERDALMAGLVAGTQTRSTVLRAVAEDADFRAREFNRAFVYMQYIGYLRRQPNDPPDSNYDGFNFWLNKLNAFDGNFIAAEMVKAFDQSGEYRGRFGP